MANMKVPNNGIAALVQLVDISLHTPPNDIEEEPDLLPPSSSAYRFVTA
jgi:hypothetical protein